jgi:hypothetical protein
MPLDDKEKKLLTLLVALTTRVENQLRQVGRQTLVPIYVLLRRLVLQLSATGAFRQYEWLRLRDQARRILMRLSDSFSSELLARLNLMEPGLRRIAADHINRPLLPATLPQRNMAETATTTVVLGVPLSQQFAPTATTNPFVERHLQDLDRTVQQGLIADRSTADIADDIIKVTTIRGEERGILATGSAARRAASKLRNFAAAAVWAVVNRETSRIWETGGPREWIWIAVLDPVTCPICRPLANQVRPTRAGFGIEPPVHPNCRCVILPRGVT